MAYVPAGLNLVIDGGTDTVRGTTTSSNPNVWFYNSADAIGTVQGSGYFSDARVRGMSLYDQVRVSVAGVPRAALQYVSAIDSSTGAATISAAA